MDVVREVLQLVGLVLGTIVGLWLLRALTRRTVKIPGAGITAFVGANGSGKTALAVAHHIKRAQRTGRPLYSTIPIDYQPRPRRWYRPLRRRYDVPVQSLPITSWKVLQSVQGADILLDEVAALASSRETIGLPPDVINLLGSLRHHDLTVSWTAPSWNRADKVLREVTQMIVVARPLVAFASPGRAWLRTYYGFAGIYDGYGASDGEAPMGRPKRIRVTPVWRLCSMGAYDSWAGVPHISEHSTTCPECGKTKRRQYCSGHEAGARPGVVAGRAPATSIPDASDLAIIGIGDQVAPDSGEAVKSTPEISEPPTGAASASPWHPPYVDLRADTTGGNDGPADAGTRNHGPVASPPVDWLAIDDSQEGLRPRPPSE